MTNRRLRQNTNQRDIHPLQIFYIIVRLQNWMMEKEIRSICLGRKSALEVYTVKKRITKST